MLTYDELASGVCHNEYISGIDIHPRGLFMATCSGDQTIKLWNITNLNNITLKSTKKILHSTKKNLCPKTYTKRVVSTNST